MTFYYVSLVSHHLGETCCYQQQIRQGKQRQISAHFSTPSCAGASVLLPLLLLSLSWPLLAQTSLQRSAVSANICREKNSSSVAVLRPCYGLAEWVSLRCCRVLG